MWHLFVSRKFSQSNPTYWAAVQYVAHESFEVFWSIRIFSEEQSTHRCHPSSSLTENLHHRAPHLLEYNIHKHAQYVIYICCINSSSLNPTQKFLSESLQDDSVANSTLWFWGLGPFEGRDPASRGVAEQMHALHARDPFSQAWKRSHLRTSSTMQTTESRRTTAHPPSEVVRPRCADGWRAPTEENAHGSAWEKATCRPRSHVVAEGNQRRPEGDRLWRLPECSGWPESMEEEDHRALQRSSRSGSDEALT